MATVADHLAALNRLLHDPDNRYWSEADKIAYISDAVQKRDLLTGQNRLLIEYELTAGDDTYSFTDLGNTRVFDVVGINLIVGSTRVVLEQRSFSELNAEFRSFTTYTSIPQAWARYGANQVVFGPAPGIAYDTEWDCSVFSAALTDTDDEDPLPYPYTDAVPYYAASLAKMNERQYDEAADFEEQFNMHINAALSARAGMVPTLYRR